MEKRVLKNRAAENPFRRDFRNADRGFSLVELIIVIAIMAILVAVLAPQFLKYVKQSRKTVDINNADEIAKVLNVAMVDVDDNPDNMLFKRHLAYQAEGLSDGRYHILFYVHSPKAYSAGNLDVALCEPYRAGKHDIPEADLKKAIQNILNNGLGLENDKSHIQISYFENFKLDMWIVCTDNNQNIQIFVGAANNENWINKGSTHPNNKLDKNWYMLYPTVSKEYEEL